MQLDNIDEMKKLLTNMEYFFMNLDDIKKNLEHQITIKEYEQEDYLHELELGNLNAIEVGRVAKKLINTRKERRTFKDKLELVNTLKGYTDKYITKGITGDTKQAIKNIENLENIQNTRSYTPRVVKDLKCAKNR